MKKIFILSCLSLFMFANEDYVPLSNFSDDKKFEYNFINNTVIDAQNIKTDSTIQDEGYSSIKTISEMEEKEITLVDEVKPIKEVKTNNEEVLKDIKKENILKDIKKENKVVNTQDKDFSISPKLTFTYLTTDISGTDTISAVDEKSVLVPEIAFKYKNHILKADFMESKSYFNKVLLIGSDLKTDTKWYKINYLYAYKNADFGLAYNKYSLDWQAVDYGINLKTEKEEFPSLEVNFTNKENQLQAQYGLSYGKNNNIQNSYEYYLNLGYEIIKNDALIVSAGYKNKTIEFENEIKNGYRFEYKGPTLSLGGTF